MAPLVSNIYSECPYTHIPNIFIDHYMCEANPAYSLTYLYFFRHACADGELDTKKAAESLKMLESDIMGALRYWDKQGLVRFIEDEGGCILDFLPVGPRAGQTPAPPAPAPISHREAAIMPAAAIRPAAPEAKAPSASIIALTLKNPAGNGLNRSAGTGSDKNDAEDTGARAAAPDIKPAAEPAAAGGRAESRPAYSVQELEIYRTQNRLVANLFGAAEQKLGKLLNFNDLSVIFGMYDWLGLPPDVIEYLLGYCADNGHRNMRYIERVALDWADNGVFTLQAARQYVLMFNRDFREIMAALGQTRRAPTSKEIGLMKKWLSEYRMPLDVVLEACDRAVTRTGRPGMKYVDTVLTGWRDKGVDTAEAVKADDERFQAEAGPRRANAAKPEAKAQPKPNRFINFAQREWDFGKIEELEREYIAQSLLDESAAE